MAKVEGPQEIPSALLDGYRATLGEIRPDDGVRKRYPYRVPTMQTDVGRPSPKQKAQRDRFNIAVGNFAGVDWPGRQRWYAAMPEWGSLLWYYNYFIMSSLGGNANIADGGAGMIKSIQFVKEEVPTTGGKAYAINAVDPAKTVVMMFGNSFISDLIQSHFGTIGQGATVNIGLSPNVDPDIAEVKVFGGGGYQEIAEGSGSGTWGDVVVSALVAAQVSIKLTGIPGLDPVPYAVQVIEHKAQTIYPVIVSVAAEVVNIDWAKEPTVPADISLIVIEYI